MKKFKAKWNGSLYDVTYINYNTKVVGIEVKNRSVINMKGESPTKTKAIPFVDIAELKEGEDVQKPKRKNRSCCTYRWTGYPFQRS